MPRANFDFLPTGSRVVVRTASVSVTVGGFSEYVLMLLVPHVSVLNIHNFPHSV